MDTPVRAVLCSIVMSEGMAALRYAVEVTVLKRISTDLNVEVEVSKQSLKYLANGRRLSNRDAGPTGG